MPAPEALGAGDMVLYAAPAAVATWSSSLGILERASNLPITLKVVVSRTVDALRKQWDSYLDLLAHAQPAMLLASERIHHLEKAPWSRRNESSILSSIHIYNYPALLPIFVPPLPPLLGPDICPLPVLGACVIGSDVPDPVATYPAGGVHPSDAVKASHSTDLGQRRPNLELLDELEGPTSLIVYEPPPPSDEFALSLNVRDQPYLIIHVRACLVGLVVACCVVYLFFFFIKFTLRLAFPLTRSVYNMIHSLSVSSYSVTKRLFGNMLGISTDTWGKLWRPVLEAHIRYATRTKITPVAPLVVVERPALVANSRKIHKKKNKKAKKVLTTMPLPASTTAPKVLSRSVVPTTSGSQMLAASEPDEDQCGEWTTVTRARKTRRTPGPVPGGSGSGSKGGRGRQ
ncbi:hypothetical protein FS749_011548 [Ceratobasidium sp. UAMH 11750]|nr:hypothetical protein FS749_011548 [Ceratobasidium sp. UAMH 11750]